MSICVFHGVHGTFRGTFFMSWCKIMFFDAIGTWLDTKSPKSVPGTFCSCHGIKKLPTGACESASLKGYIYSPWFRLGETLSLQLERILIRASWTTKLACGVDYTYTKICSRGNLFTFRFDRIEPFSLLNFLLKTPLFWCAVWRELIWAIFSIFLPPTAVKSTNPYSTASYW